MTILSSKTAITRLILLVVNLQHLWIVSHAFTTQPSQRTSTNVRQHQQQSAYASWTTRNNKFQPQQDRKRPFVLFSESTSVQQDEDIETCDDTKFDLDTALFCGGLAFDAYTEPPQTSSRWERGSQGMNVAFLSTAFTRNLYKGLVEVTPIKCSGLPDDDDNMEKMMTGSGVDACLLVAAVESQWKEDMETLKQQYHEGVFELSGAAHVGRSSTAWSNVNENKSKAAKKKTGKALAYHIRSGWGKDAQAVWEDEDPFYLYVQDPTTVRLVFTIFDDDVVGKGSAIGSTHAQLSALIPQVKYSQKNLVESIKTEIVDKIRSGELDPQSIDEEIAKAVNKGVDAWEGDLKLTSKPRIKDKNGQVTLGMAAGAMVAGPVGAAMGAVIGNMYEGQIKGRVRVRLRYLPIPQLEVERKRYSVLGGLPGVNWGSLYEKYLTKRTGLEDDNVDELANFNVGGNDLEHCFFINHDVTGACCAVYRSLTKKLIVVSFRGTCAPVDLLTDASIVQETWVAGEDPKKDDVAKVHGGFRTSLQSISRRLKELLLATVAPGDDISDYDMLVTGHSLGGALATLFIADIGEFGIDAGRNLPQTAASDDWWKAITNTVMGQKISQSADSSSRGRGPPRPKSLRLYNFGSPRVGNTAFSKRFDTLLQDGRINQAYRLVNNQDVVARLPRTMFTLGVNYDHCGSTVVVSTDENQEVLWIEKESNDMACPVRDFERRTSSPTGEGTLLGDIMAAMQGDGAEEKSSLSDLATKMSKRLASMSASDVASLVGIDRSFTDRELTMASALLKGEALAHHMEDSYYAAMGRAGGFAAIVGQDIVPIEQGEAFQPTLEGALLLEDEEVA